MFHKLISTGLGIGYIGKGAGTVAAVLCCLCWYIFQINGFAIKPAVVITVLITALGIWSSGEAEKFWGPDPTRVVVDEIAGMCITLLFLPVTVKYVLAGLILFRFFDIVKPLYIKRMEKVPGGWGIMLDDVLAGVYSNLILQAAFHYKWL